MRTDIAGSALRTGDEGLNRTIERAKQELEHMIDLNPQVMLLVDRSGKAVRANRALLELLGQPDFQKILGRGIGELFPCEDGGFFSRLLASKGGYDVREATITFPPRNHRLMRFAVVSANSDVSVIIVNDVTSEKELAAHLEKKYKKEAVQALMGGLMHNLNQPLTVIMVQAQFMQLALEKGLSQPEDMKSELQNIMALTLQVSDTLKMMENPRDFVTQPYMNGIDILDIQRSGDQAAQSGTIGPAALAIIMRALETHEPGAAKHAERTSRTAGIIAARLGLSEAECNTVRRCAYFHDIGKIAIPDSILQKPQCLTEEERKVIHSHPEIGFNLLSTFSLLRDEAETALTHSEHCDGTGYPRGLKRAEIPLYSRITAVADAFDALTSARAYQAPLPPDTALERISEGAGSQFDPDVVEALKQCVREIPG